MRTVGRTEDLRAQLFSNSLVVQTLEPLGDPGRLFTAISGVDGWRSEGPGSYVLSAPDPKTVAPEVTRALVAAGADVVSIGEAKHSLEDVYLQLVDEDVEARAQ